MTRKTALTLWLLVSLCIAGCGSGGGGTQPPTPTPPTTSAYEVDLTWEAPTASSDPVAGYNIYRAASGSSTYQLLNSSIGSSTSYSDTTVANNTSYTYYIESVDAEGNQSVPSNTYTVSIP
jgi:fibronectin type 3 domain-containing protein